MTESEMQKRIDRMENKIDKLVDAVTELVRVEATLVGISERINNHSELIKQNDTRLDTIEKKVPIYDLVVRVINRVGLVAGTVIVAGIVSSYFVFGS